MKFRRHIYEAFISVVCLKYFTEGDLRQLVVDGGALYGSRKVGLPLFGVLVGCQASDDICHQTPESDNQDS